jgi:carboxymethylenebutenolidase
MESFLSGGRRIGLESRVPAGPERYPALLILHGSEGLTREWFEEYSKYCIGRNFAVFAVRYFDRTQTEFAHREKIQEHFPEWLETVSDALTCVVKHPSVDASRLGILGISLGGFLATALATQDARVCAVVEAFGGIPEQFVPRVSSAMAPVLILHGDADTTVPVSEAHKLERLLTQHRVEHLTKIYRGQGHRFTGLRRMDALFTILRFLRQHLSVPSPGFQSVSDEAAFEGAGGQD